MLVATIRSKINQSLVSLQEFKIKGGTSATWLEPPGETPAALSFSGSAAARCRHYPMRRRHRVGNLGAGGPAMVEEGLSSEAKALELRFAAVVNAERAPFLTIGERRQEGGQLGVGTVRGDQALDAVAPIPAAPLAHDLNRRFADVGQGKRAVARHGGLLGPGLANSGTELPVI